MDEFDRIFLELKDKLEKERRRLKIEQERLDKERNELNDEKKKLQMITKMEDDLVSLNVGGEIFSCKRSTLCLVDGSFMKSIFNGNWEERMERDSAGNLFFDFNPVCFRKIVNYLRLKRIETPERPAPFPVVPPDIKKEFDNLAFFLGLEDEFQLDIKDHFSTSAKSSGITISEGGKIATKDSTNSHQYVLGERLYSKGIIQFSLRIESIQDNNQWIHVGVITETPQSNDTYSAKSNYGWSSARQVYVDGENTKSYCDYTERFQQGDLLYLTLDCGQRNLYFEIQRARNRYELPLSKSYSLWRLHINLYGKNNQIQLMEVRSIQNTV